MSKWTDQLPEAAREYIGDRRVDEVECVIGDIAGVARGKAYLKYLLEAAFEGLSEVGWRKLSRNWGLFFLVLAVLNEVLRRYYNVANGNFGTWISLKLWLFMPLSFLFTFTQLPMLLRHGLLTEAEDEVLSDPPHE